MYLIMFLKLFVVATWNDISVVGNHLIEPSCGRCLVLPGLPSKFKADSWQLKQGHQQLDTGNPDLQLSIASLVFRLTCIAGVIGSVQRRKI
jgi:hypothetical protein